MTSNNTQRDMRPAIAASILRNPLLGPDERRMALILLQFTDRAGVIRDAEINDFIHESLHGESADRAPKLPRNRGTRENR